MVTPSDRPDRQQHWWVVLIALTVSVAAIASAAFTQSGSPHGRPSAQAGSTASPQATTSRALDIGVAYGDTLPFMSDQKLASALDDAVTLGAKWVRADLSWEDIQPDSPDRYQWDRFDRVAEAAQKRGLHILAVISFTPPWARPSSCAHSQACAPADPATFAAFAHKAAARYSAMGVHTWEIWNEENIQFWQPKPDPAGYTRLLKLTTKAMRSADPKATLLMGGLAAVPTNPSQNHVSQSDYLTAVAKLGATHLVDGIAYHPYTFPYLPSARTTFGTAFEKISSTSVNLVSILAAYGSAKLPIWITETGAPTNGPGAVSDGVHIPPETTHVTEAFQAAIAADTVSAAAANPHVAAVFWFADQDTGTDRTNRAAFFGLRRIDGTAKPSFAALKNAITTYEESLNAAP
ncbi:cellulase family glycosylhydrolase [Streptacidiphilus fuscans]|uniref:Cellulase family glycosylhydrolase n=1 Tax=Streptacidiphilus fuscans TaxID=2789292 RepID=A0A931AZB1_9ACTN|nr:cellulase family glycosylhydrolase [Streptacidiphilus fuscans]MBF9068290.1 cellulase family glycosylhydrolase [Streptacidiphilus fuscans]